MTFLPESCMKKGKWWSATCNYKQLYKSLCVSSTKLKQLMKGSLCYSESIYVQFRLNKSILQELWIFFACMYTKKICLQLQWLGKSYVIGFSHLQCGLKYSPCSTEWIDVYCKLICGNVSILWNRLLMISTRDRESMPIGNSQLSKTGYESCLLYCTVTSIEQKIFTFKHGLNIGWSIYRLFIIRLQVQWINGNSCYKRC